MFLISFSENILFSLTADQRDRKGRRDGQKRNERKAVKRKRNPEKYMHSGCVEAWACTVGKIQAGRECLCVCVFAFTHAHVCMNRFL